MKKKCSKLNYVYFLTYDNPGFENLIKIGTTGDIKQRIGSYITSNPFPVKLLGVMLGDRDLEHKIHQMFSDLRFKNEWFKKSNELDVYIQKHAKPLLSYESTPRPKIIRKPKDIQIFLATNLQHLIKSNTIIANDLAFKTQIPRTTLHQWTKKAGSPKDIRKLKLIAEYFNISIDVLLFADLRNGGYNA